MTLFTYPNAMRTTKKRMTEICIALTFIATAFAGNWHDDFASQTAVPAEKEGVWQQEGNESVWLLEDGMLTAETRPRKLLGTLVEHLHFTAIPAPYEEFTVILHNASAENAHFGISLAKHFGAGETEDTGYYLFFTNDMRVSRNGKVFVGDGNRWHTDELEQLEVRFHAGRFQLFADGESRLDFRDANFDNIDSISLVLASFVQDNGKTGKAWADGFTFSSPALDVSSKGKLATTWGMLKKFSVNRMRSDR